MGLNRRGGVQPRDAIAWSSECRVERPVPDGARVGLAVERVLQEPQYLDAALVEFATVVVASGGGEIDDEADVFEYLRLKYVAPEDRSV